MAFDELEKLCGKGGGCPGFAACDDFTKGALGYFGEVLCVNWMGYG